LNLDDYIQGGLKTVYGMDEFFDPDIHKDDLGCLSFLGIMRQIASGLSFIHSKGELHRDLKPKKWSCSLALNADCGPSVWPVCGMENNGFRTHF